MIFRNFFRANRTREEVIGLLKSLIDRTITDEEWDDFISMKIEDPALDEARGIIEELWSYNSPYLVPGSVNPRDLNPKGVSRILQIIESLEEIDDGNTN